MQRDLKTYFGHEVSVETRKMPCWVLSATGKAKKDLRAKNPGQEYSYAKKDFAGAILTNAKMRNLIVMLSRTQRSLPFIDETGIEGEIDIDINANVNVLDEMIESLRENGLILKKEKRPMKVVVIRDPGGDNQKSKSRNRSSANTKKTRSDKI